MIVAHRSEPRGEISTRAVTSAELCRSFSIIPKTVCHTHNAQKPRRLLSTQIQTLPGQTLYRKLNRDAILHAHDKGTKYPQGVGAADPHSSDRPRMAGAVCWPFVHFPLNFAGK